MEPVPSAWFLLRGNDPLGIMSPALDLVGARARWPEPLPFLDRTGSKAILDLESAMVKL